MKKLRNNQGIIIFLALALVVSMTAIFAGMRQIPTAPGGAVSTGNISDWVQRGNRAYDEGNFADAIHYYEHALELNPNMVGVLVDLGTSYWYLNPPLPSKAIELYDQAIQLEPTFANAYFNKGVVLAYGLNKPEEAIQAWDKALTLNPPQQLVDAINNKLMPEAKEKLSSLE